ncbi:universal stress protein [Chitinophaga sp. XS-30]|uniref:universal stress protein n=1 Tax=Chitinophaga sp. XS-30 TaxID=2604421 RepID=UPI0011DD864B|nr:universal stress protein [Chitinophaga sp. XS-30]QEH42681.1 hypothetical protein FW415_18075 [Chitinophaga sp. XS-30]
MKNILVPTDFSAAAERAFRAAFEIASQSGGNITLYHSLIPLESVFIETDEKRRQYNRQTKANVRKRMRRLINKVAGGSEVEISTVISHLPVISSVLEYGQDNDIDLIIMGTQGASGLKKVVLGSIAAAVAGKSNIPVLLVPENAVWQKPGHIVFATGCREADENATAYILQFAKIYRATVEAVHLYKDDPDNTEKEKKDFTLYKSYLQKTFGKTNLKFRLIKTASVKSSIEMLDTSVPYDMMAMVRRRKTLLERFFLTNLTRNMACVTSKPLLIVPETIKSKKAGA